MKVRLKGDASKAILKSGQFALFTTAILMLGYCGWVWADSWYYQRQAEANLERSWQKQNASVEGSREPQPQSQPMIGPDGLIGRLEIPRLDISVVVAEGTDGR
ncbi:MAG: hypothetical protein ABI995_09715, partial [Acidobacteriota bacterium]